MKLQISTSNPHKLGNSVSPFPVDSANLAKIKTSDISGSLDIAFSASRTSIVEQFELKLPIIPIRST